MSVWLILFYILLTIGALCSIISFVILASLGSLMARMSERLGELIDILFIVGNKKQADRSMENLTGQGRGLSEVPGDPQRYAQPRTVGYDERYSNPLPPEQVKDQPIGPDGRKSNDGWETGL